MSEQEYKVLFDKYKSDIVIKNTLLMIVGIKTQSVPIAFTSDGLLYAKDVEMRMQDIMLDLKEYVRRNYSRLIDGN